VNSKQALETVCDSRARDLRMDGAETRQGPVLAVQTETSERSEMKTPVQVMKFGGTSVGDAECIARTAQIIASASRERPCVAVVSAMSGVTNRLIEAAKIAQTGDAAHARAALEVLRTQHEAALVALVKSETDRADVRK
jgi:hypothetical protein